MLTINEIQSVCPKWFSPDNMRFFKCRILDTVYSGPGGVYFVTSEKGPSGIRRYSVRQFVGKSIDTVGEFNELTKYRAQSEAKRLAATPLLEQFTSTMCELDRAITGDCRDNHLTQYGTPYLAANGDILYLSDGGYTRVKPVMHSDGSGFCLSLIETGVTSRAEAWSAAYKLQRQVCRVLQTAVHGPIEPATGEANETHNPISEDTAFRMECLEHGCAGATPGRIIELCRLADIHSALQVAACNGTGGSDANCERKITELVKVIGAKGVKFSGDPRGCTVKLIFADGATNDWGREGWCVPQ